MENERMVNGIVLGSYGHGGSPVHANSCYTNSHCSILLEE